MKLNLFDKNETWISEKGHMFEVANIIEAHRFIYLFFDANDVEAYKLKRENTYETKFGKAIQVNISISRGGRDTLDLVPWVRGSDNSTQMFIQMYIYDTVFDRSVTNIQNAEFILTEALTSGSTNDYDLKKTMINGFNIYSKDIRDNESKKMMLQEKVMEGAPFICDPMYYTMQHQEVCEDDIYCISTLSNVITHYGHELIDDNTSISIMNMSEMETLEPAIKAKLYQVKYALTQSNYKLKMFDSMELSSETMYQDLMSMQHGFTYIYDTNMGANIIRTKRAFIPFQKHQFHDKLQYDIESTLNTIKRYAKGVEKELGPVRLTFTPLYYGDKVDAYFKDWNPDNQPVVKQNIGIDNGLKVKQEISTYVDDNLCGGEEE